MCEKITHMRSDSIIYLTRKAIKAKVLFLTLLMFTVKGIPRTVQQIYFQSPIFGLCFQSRNSCFGATIQSWTNSLIFTDVGITPIAFKPYQGYKECTGKSRT
jgi:hypothetical protein